jgi:hypothetical protein
MPPGFPIQRPPDRCSFASSPEIFAGCRVFRRLSMPRHPPCTLKSLATFTGRRRQGRAPIKGHMPSSRAFFCRKDARPVTDQNYAKKVPDDACPNRALKYAPVPDGKTGESFGPHLSRRNGVGAPNPHMGRHRGFVYFLQINLEPHHSLVKELFVPYRRQKSAKRG